MSNLDKAYEMILRHISRDCESCYSTLGPCSACEDYATDAAHALADAGLLAPDLPDLSVIKDLVSNFASLEVPAVIVACKGPDGVDSFRKNDSVMVVGDARDRNVTIYLVEEEAFIEPDAARRAAHALLAAADYAEGKE